MGEKIEIQVFTGEGKGKTTAALGLAWRAVGRGKNVLVIQFLKGPDTSGEQLAAAAFGPRLDIKPMGRKGFIHRTGCGTLDETLAYTALAEVRKVYEAASHDVIILDEANVAVHLGLLDVDDVLELMDSKPPQVELILTGRHAPEEVIKRADAVLEMKKIKHHFDAGIPAGEGIEY